MDPNETLKQLRNLVEYVGYADVDARDDMTEQAEEFATLFEALDQWLSKDGMLPSSWGSRAP